MHDVHGGAAGGHSSSMVVAAEYGVAVVEGDGAHAERTTATGRPLRRRRSASNRLTSPKVADIRRTVSGSAPAAAPATPTPVRVGVEMELVHHHLIDRCVGPQSQRHVGQDLGGGADDRGAGLMEASPVSMPTLSLPSCSHRAKNFSDTSALMGACTRSAGGARARRRAPRAR